METLTISLKHIASQRDQPCAACGASFVPAEDAGSRVLSLKAPAQEAFGGLMCGGCYSKWSHPQLSRSVTLPAELSPATPGAPDANRIETLTKRIASSAPARSGRRRFLRKPDKSNLAPLMQPRLPMVGGQW